MIDGGLDVIEMMFVAAWVKKYDDLTEGNGVECGKNSTVSELTADLVLGMQH